MSLCCKIQLYTTIASVCTRAAERRALARQQERARWGAFALGALLVLSRYSEHNETKCYGV